MLNQKKVYEINQTAQTAFPWCCTYVFARTGGRRTRSHLKYSFTARVSIPDIFHCTNSETTDTFFLDLNTAMKNSF